MAAKSPGRVLAILCAAHAGISAQVHPVLINGKLGEGEWDDAEKVQLDVVTELLLKRDERYLYLAIHSSAREHSGLDVYLANVTGPIVRLHISAALGEAAFHSGRWDELRWGENRRWTANVVGSIREEGEVLFLTPEAFELQVDMELLGPEPWRCLAHLKRPEAMLPLGAELDQPDTWLLVEPRDGTGEA